MWFNATRWLMNKGSIKAIRHQEHDTVVVWCIQVKVAAKLLICICSWIIIQLNLNGKVRWKQQLKQELQRL